MGRVVGLTFHEEPEAEEAPAEVGQEPAEQAAEPEAEEAPAKKPARGRAAKKG